MVAGRKTSLVNIGRLLAVACCHLLVLTGFTTQGSRTPPATTTFDSSDQIHLDVICACRSEATLLWTRHSSGLDDPGPPTCDFSYHPEGDSNAEILELILEGPSHHIRLFNLSRGSVYTASLVCFAQVVDKVSFVSGSHCTEDDTNHTHSKGSAHNSSVPTFLHGSTFDVVEWPIAVAFILIGFIIGSVVAYCMWKKYRRRQRILRIFRQGQNDPFQALYSPTQDSYSF